MRYRDPRSGSPPRTMPIPWPNPGTELGSTHGGVLPVRVCALTSACPLDEQLHDRRVVFADGDHQRRLLELGIFRVDDGAASRAARFTASRLADARRRHERRFAGRIGRVRIGAGVEQQAGSCRRCRSSTPGTAASRRSGWRASHPRPPESAAGPSRGRPRGPASGGPACRPAWRVDVGLLIQQRSHGVPVALHRRVGEPRIGLGDGASCEPAEKRDHQKREKLRTPRRLAVSMTCSYVGSDLSRTKAGPLKADPLH